MSIETKPLRRSLSPIRKDFVDSPRQNDLTRQYSDACTNSETLKVGDVVYVLSSAKEKHEVRVFGQPAPDPTPMCVQAEGIADVRAVAVPLGPGAVRKSLASFKLFSVEKCLYEFSDACLPKDVSKDFLERNRGADVQYGDYIQLRHMHSGKFLQFSTHPSKTLGGHRVEVGPRAGGYSLIQVRGFAKQGQPVRLHSDVELVVRCEFLDYYLSVDKRRFPQERLELHASTQRCSWQMGRFTGYSGKKNEVMLNSPFVLRHKALGLNFTVIGGHTDEESGSSAVFSSVASDFWMHQVPVLMNNRYEPQCFWMLESVQECEGGPVEAGVPYYVRHLFTMKYLTCSFSLSADPIDTFTLRLLSGSETKMTSGGAIALEDSFGRKLEAQLHKVKLGSRCIIPAASKKASHGDRVEVQFAFSGGDRATFEVLQEKSVANFAMWTCGMLPVIQRCLWMLETLPLAGEYEDEVYEELDDMVEVVQRTLNEIAGQISDLREVREQVKKKQNLGIGFKLHVILIRIALHLIRRVKLAAEEGSVIDQWALLHDEDQSSFAQMAKILKRLLPDSLSLLNTLAKDNKLACKALSLFVADISEIFPFEKALVGSLLSEIHRMFNPSSPAKYLQPLCAKLAPVTSDNIEEQTLYLSLIRGLAEEGFGVRPHCASVLYSYFKDMLRSDYFFFRLRFKNTTPFVEFFPSSDFTARGAQLRANPDIITCVEKVEESLCFSLVALSGKPAYVEYVAEGLLLINIFCNSGDGGVKSLALAFGFDSSSIFAIVRDTRLHLSLRSAALTLLTTLVLDLQQLAFSTRKSNLSFCLDEVERRGSESPLFTKESDSEAAELIKWCLDFWSRTDSADEMFAYGTLANLKHLLAVLQLTYSLANFEYVTHYFGRAVNAAILDLLISLFSSQSEHHGQNLWMRRVGIDLGTQLRRHPYEPSTPRQSMSFRASRVFRIRGLEDTPMDFAAVYCLRAVQDMTLRLVRLNLERSQRAKLEQLLRIHYRHRYQPRTPDSQALIAAEVQKVVADFGLSLELAQIPTLSTDAKMVEARGRYEMMVPEPRFKEFLASATLSDRALSPYTRQELLTLLHEMLEANNNLIRMLKGVDLIEERDARDSMEFLNSFSKTFSFLKHGKALRERLRTDQAERNRLQASLEQLLSIFSLKSAKPILAKKMQNLARSYRLHYELAALVKQLSAIPESQVLLSLVATALMNFCYENAANRKELLSRVSSRFFCLATPQLPYVIQEISNFEHMTHAEAQHSFTFILERSLQPHEDMLAGLHWIRAIISYRSGGYKQDMQTLACFRTLSYLQQTQFSLFAETQEAGELVLLLADCAYGNPVAAKHCKQIAKAQTVADTIAQAKSPLTVRAWLCFLHDVYFSEGSVAISRLLLANILTSLLPWIDQVQQTFTRLLPIASSGAYEQIWTKARPYHIPQLAYSSREAQLWQMLSYGEPWQRNTGLLAVLPLIVYTIPAPSLDLIQAYRALYEKLLPLYSELVERADIDARWFLRVLQTCLHTLSQAFSGAPRLLRIETDHQKSLSDASTVLAEEALNNSLAASEFRSFLALTTVVIDGVSKDSRLTLKEMAINMYPMSIFTQKYILSTQRRDLARMLKLLNSKIGPELKFLIFDLLTAIIHDIPDKPAVSTVFIESGLLDSALSGVVKQPNLRLMKSSVAFLNSLLSKQSAEFMGWFLEEIKTSGAYLTLFTQVKAELECSLERIWLKKAPDSLEPHLTASERDLFASLLQSGTPIADVFALAKDYSSHLVRFTQLCCDNCNLPFQQFMSTQETSLGSVDVVEEIAKYVIIVTQYEGLFASVEEARTMTGVCIEALLDFVTGPCVFNQNKLGTDVQLLLAVNKVLRVAASQKDNPDWVAIYSTTLNFIMTLFEGSPNQGVLDSLLQYLDLDFLLEEMHDIYNRYIKGRERSLLLESPSVPPIAAVGFKIAILAAVFSGYFPKQVKDSGFSIDNVEPRNMSCNPFRFGVINGVPKDCLSFFYSFIGYVEIARNGGIESLYFQVPFICKFLTAGTREQLIMEADRSSQHEKIESFLEMVLAADVEMRHQQNLYRVTGLKFLSRGWRFYGWISFLLIMIINFIVLSETEKGEIFTGSQDWVEDVLWCMNITQMVMKALSYIFFLVEFYPSITAFRAQRWSLEFFHYPSIRHNESIFMRAHQNCKQKVSTPVWGKLSQLLTHHESSYFFVYSLLSFGCFWWRFLYPFLTLDILQHSPELGHILRAMSQNSRQLLVLGVLGIIIFLAFGDVALFRLIAYYQSDSPEPCADLWHCFINTLHDGVRMKTGGSGQPEPSVNREDPNYFARVTFDLCAYVVINVVHLNIIVGVIIDTFGQLRDERSRMMNDLHHRCFVCGTARSEIERCGSGWTKHFMNEHSPFAYMALIKYLEVKEMNECSGLEKYVKERIMEKQCDFFPTTMGSLLAQPQAHNFTRSKTAYKARRKLRHAR